MKSKKVNKKTTKKKTVTKKNTVVVDDLFCEIVNCAVRYAIGRRTYVVSDVCEFVENNITKLDAHSLALIVADINREKNYLGSPTIDAPLWRKLAKECYNELDKRKESDWLSWLLVNEEIDTRLVK